jgi:antitoxin (DNA-binding transcriptional repressor) of toxin-antitoxin stability system
MKTMNATMFKAQCLALLDEVTATGEPIRILKRGKAVAEVGPASSPTAFPQQTLLGKVRVANDTIKPVLPADAWDADKQNLVYVVDTTFCCGGHSHPISFLPNKSGHSRHSPKTTQGCCQIFRFGKLPPRTR